MQNLLTTKPRPVHEHDSFDPGLLRLVVKRRRSSFCCVTTASTHAYRGLSRSEGVRLFGALLEMMEKLKASFWSVLYSPNRSTSPEEDDQVLKEWHFAKWTDSAVTLSNDIEAYKFALYC